MGLFSMSPLFILFYFLTPSYWVIGEYFSSIFPINYLLYNCILFFVTFGCTTKIFGVCMCVCVHFLFNFQYFCFFLYNVLLLLYGNVAFSWLSPKLFTKFLLNFYLYYYLCFCWCQFYLLVIYLIKVTFSQISAMLYVHYILEFISCFIRVEYVMVTLSLSLSQDKVGYCPLLISSVWVSEKSDNSEATHVAVQWFILVKLLELASIPCIDWFIL